MERKIGETFEFEGKKLQVKAASKDSCEGCILDGKCTRGKKAITGFCERGYRDDEKRVIFVEVQEQPQKLNLFEILKNCPKGEEFWSPLLGDVKFLYIDEERQMIFVETIEGLFTWEINEDGTISIDEVTSPEIMLFPSKDQRDWSKFTAPWLKKERFDPKTLKAFDRVLVKSIIGSWTCDNFSHIDCNGNFICIGHFFVRTIPYNDETKHLVGTTDEAPEFYRYWED